MTKSRRKSTSKKSRRAPSRNQPTNKALYEKVKKEAKSKFRSWPSAYASGWLVREYKKRGGRYSGSRKPRQTTGLQRWFELEKWINVCHLPKIVPCGRPGGLSKSDYWRKFPYCRPLKRATSKTPRTARELSKSEIKKRCSRKRRSPKKRVAPKSFKRVGRK